MISDGVQYTEKGEGRGNARWPRGGMWVQMDGQMQQTVGRYKKAVGRYNKRALFPHLGEDTKFSSCALGSKPVADAPLENGTVAPATGCVHLRYARALHP